MSDNPLSFEEAMAELVETVARLEAGDLTLEETLSLFERGQVLAELANRNLNKAELKLEELRNLPDGDEGQA